tara:strand:+ start:81 stop:527 length:447 start_codon:yes stop_codon:yes gene_type:complete
MYWWQAVRENDPRVLLCAERFKERRDHDNFSNLHVACYHGHANLVTLFITQEKNINDCVPCLPIELAIRMDFHEIVRILINAGSRIPLLLDIMQCEQPTRDILLGHRTVKKWFQWAKNKRRKRELYFLHQIWLKKRVSCHLNELVKFI